jgi:hypothetical protein
MSFSIVYDRLVKVGKSRLRNCFEPPGAPSESAVFCFSASESDPSGNGPDVGVMLSAAAIL